MSNFISFLWALKELTASLHYLYIYKSYTSIWTWVNRMSPPPTPSSPTVKIPHQLCVLWDQSFGSVMIKALSHWLNVLMLSGKGKSAISNLWLQCVDGLFNFMILFPLKTFSLSSVRHHFAKIKIWLIFQNGVVVLFHVQVPRLIRIYIENRFIRQDLPISCIKTISAWI